MQKNYQQFSAALAALFYLPLMVRESFSGATLDTSSPDPDHPDFVKDPDPDQDQDQDQDHHQENDHDHQEDHRQDHD